MKKVSDYTNSIFIQDAMIEYAKYHVEQALKEASEKATCLDKIEYWALGEYYSAVIDKDSILKAYPLDLIK